MVTFLYQHGKNIKNNRSDTDFALVYDICYLVCGQNNKYPKKRSGEYDKDNVFLKKEIRLMGIIFLEEKMDYLKQE
jgi:hypothetical protein